ncbi:MAG TPA: hypothetical protein VLW65_15550 [Bryobacteraceae bacterium]|nr:hypothetical protein [Bryobacteraceae bacterium]
MAVSLPQENAERLIAADGQIRNAVAVEICGHKQIATRSEGTHWRAHKCSAARVEQNRHRRIAVAARRICRVASAENNIGFAIAIEIHQHHRLDRGLRVILPCWKPALAITEEDRAAGGDDIRNAVAVDVAHGDRDERHQRQGQVDGH